MRSTWTDSRLDDLNDRFKDLSAKVSEMDTRLTARIDSLQHTMIQVFIALMVAMFTGFIGIAGLIITQI
jgi:ABC-type transport system involved in cytochrome bd biosynthesis fused ATPase/permease subunit